MGKNKLKDDIDDVFSGWAVSQKAKENPELYEPGKGEDSPPTPTKDQKRGAKPEGLKQTVKNRPSEIDRQKRTFKDRPTGDDNETFTPDDNIPESDFFGYFNALYDVVLPALVPSDPLCSFLGISWEPSELLSGVLQRD